MPEQVRACASDDIPAISGLFQKTFRDPRARPPASLQAYLADLYLQHPWADPDLRSRVYVSPESQIEGFVGALPSRMTFRDRPVRAAVAGALMVGNPAASPLAGARLLRSFVGGPQDLSISETANPLSKGMWDRIGGTALPGYSMDWIRVLQPAQFAVATAAERYRAARLTRPFAALADLAIARHGSNPLLSHRRVPALLHDTEVDDGRLIDLLPRMAATYALRPEWDANSLCWFLGHAARKERYGTLYRRVVTDSKDAVVGCYLLYGRPGGVARVLQVFALGGAAGPVIDSLLAHVDRIGCIAVRGRTEPRLLDALLQRHCIFVHRSSTVVHTRNPELLAAINAGDACIIGMAGESWTRLIGGLFS